MLYGSSWQPALTIVRNPVGESSHADPDALQHTVTGQLVHDQRRLHLPGLLVGVGHDAAHEVRLAAVERGHEVGQGGEVHAGHRLAAPALLLLLPLRLLGRGGGLARVVGPELDQQQTGAGALEQLHHGVVHGVLVLLQPARHCRRCAQDLNLWIHLHQETNFARFEAFVALSH